jgi:hypothetical protein
MREGRTRMTRLLACLAVIIALLAPTVRCAAQTSYSARAYVIAPSDEVIKIPPFTTVDVWIASTHNYTISKATTLIVRVREESHLALDSNTIAGEDRSLQVSPDFYGNWQESRQVASWVTLGPGTYWVSATSRFYTPGGIFFDQGTFTFSVVWQ